MNRKTSTSLFDLLPVGRKEGKSGESKREGP